MSRPGYWKAGGAEIPYAQMEESHVKHALRYLRNKIIELRSGPTTTNASYRTYCEQKLIELGNEAQRRNLIPQGDVTQEQLETFIAGWQSDWDARQVNRYTRPAASYPAPVERPPEPQVALQPPTTTTSTSIETVQPSLYRYSGSSTGRFYVSKNRVKKTEGQLNKNERAEVDLDNRRLDTDL